MSSALPPSADDQLELRIADLLADERYADHPLREVLEALLERMAQQLVRLERITTISDRYQAGAREQMRHLSRRYDQQIRKLEKAIRISDRYQAMLADLNKALQEASTHDQLTGLPNRRLMADRLLQEDHRTQREGTTYSLLAIDVDRFKTINDRFGHDAGDRVLVALARAFRNGLRDYDACARWGGEEFLALLAGADLATAQLVAQRLLDAVRALQVELPAGLVQPRVSIGLAEHRSGEVYTDVYRRADDALLTAKQTGRDRFQLAEEPKPAPADPDLKGNGSAPPSQAVG
ncbi:MAG: biofilm regulation diguanylate cyclase SiaD [Cyanobium sp.]|nr:biofilm regulation diguanylate cyclase SiaD [Cyanobium sp.]